MSNYRSIDINHREVGDCDNNNNNNSEPPEQQQPSVVGTVSNLLSLFDPPPPSSGQPNQPQPQQQISSVAHTPISSGRRTPHNNSVITNEQIPLLQQQQQQQQQQPYSSNSHSTITNDTTTMPEWDDKVATTIPLLSEDDSENEFNSIMKTPKQKLRHSSSLSSSYSTSSSNTNSNSMIQSLDHRSRIDSVNEILPPIHETKPLSDHISIPNPSAPMTPISSWLYNNNNNNYQNGNNNNNNNNNNNSQLLELRMNRLAPCTSDTESLIAPTLDHHDPQPKQPLLSMNHYREEEYDITTLRPQPLSTPTTTSSWWFNPSTFQTIISDLTSPSTYIGAFLFLLFELVFSLTIGATITRSSSSSSGRSMLGLVTKIATLGTIFGGPIYWFNLRDVPALYPVVDLFAAPFLANIATIIDETLYHDPNVSDIESDEIFLTTFSFLSGVSLFISGCFMVLASVFKLANLGSFLPFPVLCGFFTAAACMTWTLAFKVDTNGLTVSHVIFSGDTRLIVMSLVHHIPSVLVGATMKYLGPKHPLFVLMSVMITIGLFYSTMFIFGISFQEMIDMHWFWSESDLHYEPPKGEKLSAWATPAPFGWINGMIGGKVHWGAVGKGLETTVALSFLYMIRCSIHGTALKKNIPTLSRVEKVKKDPPIEAIRPLALSRRPTVLRGHQRKFSEAVDIDGAQQEQSTSVDANATTVVTAKPTKASLKTILTQYGYSQLISGLVGGFAVIPCVATAPTMFMLGADRLAPQLGAALLLLIFYFTDFALVQFIPKTAFSSLLLLSSIDMLSYWCIQSYFKTEQKLEWFVVPFIVVLAFAFGLLQSVFLGIAISTFIFVASFFRSGVVKFIANGMHVRSTIERPPHVSKWLETSAMQIQILVLQNYLFFGNASSMIAYISTMFEEPETKTNPNNVMPCPKVVIIDMTLVTGMDTSAVDAFKDILTVCTNNDCKLFLSGVSPNLQRVMKLVGVHPGNLAIRSQRKLRFFVDLDTAIGKAEDVLIDINSFEEEIALPFDVQQRDGFYRALYHIDVQHNTKFATELSGLREYSTALELVPGDELYEENNDERGLFFIEHGILKMERFASDTMSRAGNSYNAMNTFRGSISRFVGNLNNHAAPRFRLARICPGWVIGNLEALAGAKPGHILAVTNCRLHYISYEKVEEIEAVNPKLVLKLYKLLSHLMTKRQEITIAQLGTLHAIMGSPACKKPLSRTLST